MAADPKGSALSSPYAIALAGIVFAILLLIGYALIVTFPANGHYLGLLYTGILGVVIGLVGYLASSLSRGTTVRMAAVGAFWFGIVMMLGAALATPNAAFGSTAQAYDLIARLWLVIIILVLAIIGLAGMWWQSTAKKVEDRREDERAEWRRTTGVVAPGDGAGPRTGGPR